MSKKIVFTPERQEEFKQDWLLMSYTNLCKKYKISRAMVNKLGKDYKCLFPKPSVAYKEPEPGPDSSASCEPFEKTKAKKGLMKMVDKFGKVKDFVSLKEIEQTKELMAEYDRTRLSDLPVKEKGRAMYKIMLDLMYAYISLFPDMAMQIEGMQEMTKMHLLERKVTPPEADELDEATLKALKRQFVAEALEDIRSMFNEAELRFYDGLLQIATKRALAIKKRESEQSQDRVIEAGVIDVDGSETKQ